MKNVEFLRSPNLKNICERLLLSCYYRISLESTIEFKNNLKNRESQKKKKKKLYNSHILL